MFKIPQDSKQFKQDNSSDRKGNIHITKNIDFHEKGYIKLSDRTRTFATSVTLTDLCTAGFPYMSAFATDSSSEYIWALGTKNIYASDYDTPTAFVKDTDTGFPTLSISQANDALEFSDDMYVVVETGTMYKKAGSTWSTISVDAASCLCLFQNLNQLAVGGDSQVELFNTSDVSQNILTIPPDYTITKMAWNKTKLAIATTNTEDNKAALFIWDGLSSSAEGIYPVPKGHTIYSVVPYKEGFACVTSAGELLYNNGGWQVLDRFPIYYTKYLFDVNSSSSPSGRKITPNAMATDGEYIYIGLSNFLSQRGNSNTPRRLQDFPSGVWCYDPEVGLHHKYSISGSVSLTTNAITTANINTTTDIITVAGVTVPESGTPVFYYNGTAQGEETSSATPLKHGEKYFTIYQSDTTLKLATTYENAIAGTAINLTGTGNNAQYLEFVKSDMFSEDTCDIGALMLLDHNFQNREQPSRFGQLLIGGSARQDDGTTIAIIASVATDQENRGYVVTPKLEAREIEEIWNDLYIKHLKLLKPEDKIVVKYRTADSELEPYETYNGTVTYTSTWSDSNTFTSTRDLSALSVGDEIEFYSGKGCGITAHITSISESSGTYTVNIDENVPDVTNGDFLRFYTNNWIKLGTITNDEFDNYKKMLPLNKKSDWIQLKIELRGSDTKISDIIVENEKLK